MDDGEVKATPDCEHTKMVVDSRSGLENDGFLSMMRTLASLTETAKLRGDTMSAGIFSSVAALLAEVHVARVPYVGG